MILFSHLWRLNLFICCIIHSVYFQQEKNLDLVWSRSLFNSPRISALRSEWFCVIKIALHSSPNPSIEAVNGGLELLIDSSGPHGHMDGLHICTFQTRHIIILKISFLCCFIICYCLLFDNSLFYKNASSYCYIVGFCCYYSVKHFITTIWKVIAIWKVLTEQARPWCLYTGHEDIIRFLYGICLLKH